MTAVPSPLLRYLAPLAIVVTAAMASANWYFEPENAAGWAFVLVLTAVMALATWRIPLDNVRGSVVFASLMLMAGLSENVAAGLGIGGAEVFDQISKRGAMVLIGAYLAFTGNAMPKMLTPLSSAQCDGTKTQAFQRFVGWVWALSGLSFAVAWLVLPLDIANPVAMTCMIAAMVITATAMLRLRRAQRPRTS